MIHGVISETHSFQTAPSSPFDVPFSCVILVSFKFKFRLLRHDHGLTLLPLLSFLSLTLQELGWPPCIAGLGFQRLTFDVATSCKCLVLLTPCKSLQSIKAGWGWMLLLFSLFSLLRSSKNIRPEVVLLSSHSSVAKFVKEGFY